MESANKSVQRSAPGGQPRRNGFTLIELLVVVAIIAVLISILLPALSKARATAQGLVCSSNMKMVGVGVQMYLRDFNDIFFPTWDQRNNATWYSSDDHETYFARDYLKMPRIAPNIPGSLKTRGNILDCPARDDGYYRRGGYYEDYAYSYELGPYQYWDGGTSGYKGSNKKLVRLSQIEMPSLSVCFNETLLDNFWFTSSSTTGNYWRITTSFSHGERANFLFIDGHATAYSIVGLQDSNFRP